MTSPRPAHFPIKFERAYSLLSRALFMSPSDSYVELDGAEVSVRMAWGFRARFPRSAVVSTAPFEQRTFSRGVHGFAGRWLVNGSGDGILAVELAPVQRAYVMGFPVKLKQLLVSVEDRAGLAKALAG